jgi:hypothetical protein
MKLSKAEQEKVNDSRLKIQSVSKALRSVHPERIPDYEEIEECLEGAEESLRQALRGSRGPEE